MTTEPKTPEEYIAALEEPRRGQIEQLHHLIREAVPELARHWGAGVS